ncbi:MAG TPA: MBL fold metallo-hydrolase [Kribbella sp.]|nr:MBL fold metallo-hydrolase [Kribbella sp.]
MDSITFIGTATTVIRLGSFTVLTDPNFLHRGQRAYLGKGLWSRRLTDPALGPSELPPLDAVVLSHLHGAHFDRVARRTLDRSVPVITTEQAARRLRRYGFAAHGLPTWEHCEQRHGSETLTVEALPAVHARGVLGKLLPPVMGSLLVFREAGLVRRRVYLTGDTLTGPHLDEIRERHPEVDVAVTHLGGTRILFATVTMDAAQGVDFLRRIRPQLTVPVHYDDYRVFRSPLGDFLAAARRDSADWQIETPARGQTVNLPEHAGPERAASGGSVAEREVLKVYQRVPGRQLSVSRVLNRDAKAVWAAVTDPVELSSWLGPTHASDTTYGLFTVEPSTESSWYTALVVTCDRDHSYTIDWRGGDSSPARLAVDVISVDGGTLLRATQTGIPAHRVAEDERLWNQRLERLASHLGAAEVPSGSPPRS